jgi:hypothetical protein
MRAARVKEAFVDSKDTEEEILEQPKRLNIE